MKIVIRAPRLNPKISQKQIIYAILTALFLIAIQVRMAYVNATGYPSNFIDYNAHTINMILSVKDLGFIFRFNLSEPSDYFKSILQGYYLWYETSPLITYLIGGIVAFSVKDVNVGWVTGSILYSLGVFTVYYIIKKLTKNEKTALLTALIYAIYPMDFFNLTKGKIIQSLGIVLFPVLLYTFYEALNKKNTILFGIVLFLTINSYIMFVGVLLISALIYLLITRVKLSNMMISLVKNKKESIKNVIKPALIAILLSLPYISRFVIATTKQFVSNWNEKVPLEALINLKLLFEKFPNDSEGIILYNSLSIYLKLAMIALVIILTYLIIKKKASEKEKLTIALFSGPLIFYLLQFLGFASYPRRILYQVPILFIIATGLLITYLFKIKNKKKYIIIIPLLALIGADFTNQIIKISSATENTFMNDARYEAITWGRENIPENETILFLELSNGYSTYKWYYFRKLYENMDISINVYENILPPQVMNYNYVVITESIPGMIFNSLKTLGNTYGVIHANKEVVILKKQ